MGLGPEEVEAKAVGFANRTHFKSASAELQTTVGCSILVSQYIIANKGRLIKLIDKYPKDDPLGVTLRPWLKSYYRWYFLWLK